MIPFLDLKAQYHQIKPEVDAAIARAIDSTQFVLGPEVAAFEERFASYCNVSHCRAVNSGTSALHLALLAAGVGPGDEVITVSMTFVATTAAILLQRRKAGLRRRRSRHLDDESGLDRGCDHAANQGDPAGPSARPDGRHGSDHGDRPPPRARRHRGRGAGAWRRIQGPSRRIDRRSRLLQLLSRQEPRSIWRGRSGRHQSARIRTTHFPAARLGAGIQIQSRRRRLQLSHGRHSGRGAEREDELHRSLDRGAPISGRTV